MKTVTTVIATVLVTLVVLAAAGLIYIHSGAYSVAATDPPTNFAHWLLDTVQVNSVNNHAQDVAPPRFTEEMVARGAHQFDEMCVVCHGGPGVEPSAIGKGLRPDPPEVGHIAREFTDAEVFWIVNHGIKMTGMPAFGKTHDEEALWNVVAFVERTPTMSPEEYEALVDEGARLSGGHHASGGAEARPGEERAEAGRSQEGESQPQDEM